MAFHVIHLRVVWGFYPASSKENLSLLVRGHGCGLQGWARQQQEHRFKLILPRKRPVLVLPCIQRWGTVMTLWSRKEEQAALA